MCSKKAVNPKRYWHSTVFFSCPRAGFRRRRPKIPKIFSTGLTFPQPPPPFSVEKEQIQAILFYIVSGEKLLVFFPNL